MSQKHSVLCGCKTGRASYECGFAQMEPSKASSWGLDVFLGHGGSRQERAQNQNGYQINKDAANRPWWMFSKFGPNLGCTLLVSSERPLDKVLEKARRSVEVFYKVALPVGQASRL